MVIGGREGRLLGTLGRGGEANGICHPDSDANRIVERKEGTEDDGKAGGLMRYVTQQLLRKGRDSEWYILVFTLLTPYNQFGITPNFLLPEIYKNRNLPSSMFLPSKS